MKEIATIVLLIIGGAFMFLAALGIVRMPDLFTRLQAATKGATLGISCMLLASAIHFAELGIISLGRALLIILFFFLTNPVAAHMISRAAYLTGARLWEKTTVDEWKGRPYLSGTSLQETNDQIRKVL